VIPEKKYKKHPGCRLLVNSQSWL